MPTNGTTFSMRQLQNYHQKKKQLNHISVDLEKVPNRAPREVIQWVLRRKQVPKRMATAISAPSVGTRTHVKAAAGTSEEFGIEI